MSAGIENWPVPPELLDLIDQPAISAADTVLPVVERLYADAAAAFDAAFGELDAALTAWSKLKERAGDGEAIAADDIASASQAVSTAQAVADFKSEAAAELKGRLDQAKAARAGTVAEAHRPLSEAGIALRIRAGRAADLANAVMSAPVSDPRDLDARRPAFEEALREAHQMFRNGSAAIWHAERAGSFRGNYPEALDNSWPTTEVVQRQIFGLLPSAAFVKAISVQDKLSAVAALLRDAREAHARAAEAPGADVERGALKARLYVLESRARGIVDDLRFGNTPDVSGLVRELAVAELMFNEEAGKVPA